MKSKLAILLWAANPEAPHLCAAPFFNAAVAAAMDVTVELYFTGKSVQLLVPGVAARLPSGPRERRSVYDFMQDAAGHGAQFYACRQALDEHGLAQAALIELVSGSAGVATYVSRALDEEWSVLVF